MNTALRKRTKARLKKIENRSIWIYAGLFIIAISGHVLLGERYATGLEVVLAVGLIIVANAITLRFQRKFSQISIQHNDKISEEHYRQITEFHGLHTQLNPRAPLPPMRAWAISPDFGNLIVSECLKIKPKCVVELGSGSSTVILGYMIEKGMASAVYSFDHDETFLKKTRTFLENHKLQQGITIDHAPLAYLPDMKIEQPWYSIDIKRIAHPIDMLIIDGPPEIDETSQVRWPALPFFFDRLADGATILLDDGARQNTQHTVARWAESFPDLNIEFFPLEKGAFVIRKMGQLKEPD